MNTLEKMKKRKISVLLAGALLCATSGIGAVNVDGAVDGGIKGIVMDGELGGPLGFVTVQVKAKGSDKIIQGSITGDNGGYVINGLKKGNYVVTFSYVGYKEVSKNISITRNNQVLNLGELTLVEDANRLGEVEVVGRTELHLRNGTALPVSRTFYRPFQGALVRYLNRI